MQHLCIYYGNYMYDFNAHITLGKCILVVNNNVQHHYIILYNFEFHNSCVIRGFMWVI
jgi:hypothetical protein